VSGLRPFLSIKWIPAWACLFAVLGCGGGGGGAGGTILPVGVTVTPGTATVDLNATQTFTASVANANNTAVTWSVQEGAAGGSITQTGVYTAPGTAGNYRIIATSVADPTKSATAFVTVPVAVTVNPPSATMTLRQSQAFTATVQGTANTGVLWSLQEANAGSITSGGLYTAPSVPGVYHVVAQSVADSTRKAVATVTVQAGSASGTIQ
jgi:hypothetical protein